MEKLKVLVIAYSCAPGRGSEWGAGFAFVEEMSRHQPIWLITHADNRTELDPFIAKNQTNFPIAVEYVRLGRWASWLNKLGYTAHNFYYYAWHVAAGRRSLAMHQQTGFDVVQHISYMRWWMPTAAAALAKRGVKFIFGPVVGGDLMPPAFRKHVSWFFKLGEFQRRVARELWRRDPRLASAIRASDLCLAGTPLARDAMLKLGAKRVELVCSGTMSAKPIIDAARNIRVGLDPGRPFSIVSVGGMSYYRGIDLALRAFAKANIPNSTYTHACDGPMRPALEKLATELGIAGRVIFTGDAPHAQNVNTASAGDVYLHLVLRDSMGVMPDAMACGVPVLSVDLNTAALMVNDQVGHKINLEQFNTPELVVDEVARVLRLWWSDPALRKKLGENAIQHAKQFTRESRGEQFRMFHQQVMGVAHATARRPKAIPNHAA